MLHASTYWIADKSVHLASALHFTYAAIDRDVSRFADVGSFAST